MHHDKKINSNGNRSWVGLYQMLHDRKSSNCTNGKFTAKCFDRSDESESVCRKRESILSPFKGRAIPSTDVCGLKTRCDTKKKVRFNIDVVEDFQADDKGTVFGERDQSKSYF